VKRWLIRFLVLCLLAGVAIWGWHFLFPSQEELIRKQLTRLAQAACIRANESQLARMAHAQSLTTFFTPDAHITVDLPGRLERTFDGRDELLEAAGGAQASMSSLKVEFLDVTVQVGADGKSATAAWTIEANLPGENVPEVQQVKAELKKTEGDWLIERAETVKTLR
jgi:hypothetical protein